MPLFPKKAYTACANCRHGRKTSDGQKVLCMRNGIVDPDYSCRKYQYDPIKRVPKRRPALPAFSPEEFKL